MGAYGDTRAESGSIKIPSLTKPNGEGSLGYGESFSLDTATGAARFDIPVFLSTAREFPPPLTPRYSSSNTNGLFGLGFVMELPSISRRTSLGIPRYSASDQFVAETCDVLVPYYRPDGDAWRPVVWTHVEHRREYRRRIEASSGRIRRWANDADGWDLANHRQRQCDKRRQLLRRRAGRRFDGSAEVFCSLLAGHRTWPLLQ
ncbi:Mono(ADP-ribosyl)transferase SpvB [Burkholderia lata]|uniref:SpvB/TcaC N-terminal domain-containing protein n=1 Tax=Burkholderia lata (strain ATCC 17760 / DSM 23089 / LMG 22485 / NCIMB 9086 / R18194 / 383) TaxID=482957 RepID=UPI001453E1A1|nr:SpvB/TcaC N-terminal domain-containing protein [Burkholderia lata]VWD33815.1 Mono(ADP-ribosyl)transferase SpvB [Burkholderia lata]